MEMIHRILWLTWSKGLLMAAVYGALLLGHFAVEGLWRVDDAVLLLGATFFVPMWAICAAVYTFDNFMLAPGRGRRRPA